jgi:tetratricopeptide (TPR) repeat protein
MSPEQARGRADAMGPATDVYSMGCTLYALLSGRPPFHGRGVMEIIALLQESDRIPPARLDSSVPRDLETICLKALAREPGLRYHSARALADDLHRFVQGEPIRAGRLQTTLYQSIRWLKRRPLTPLMVIAMFMLISVAALQHTELRELRARLGVWNDLAQLDDVGRRDQLRTAVNRAAESELQSAVELGEKAVREEPRRLEERRSLARAYRRLGDLFINTARPEGASSVYRRATEILRQCLEIAPGHTESIRELGQVLGNAAETARALGQTGQANEHYRDALGLMRRLVAEHPESPAFRLDLERTLDGFNAARTSRPP